MSLSNVSPSILEVIVGEQINFTIDFTNLLAPGDSCSSPSLTLKTSYNESVPTAIAGTPTFTGNLLSVTLNTSLLRSKTNYVLVASCVASGGGTNKNVSGQLAIKVIY